MTQPLREVIIDLIDDYTVASFDGRGVNLDKSSDLADAILAALPQTEGSEMVRAGESYLRLNESERAQLVDFFGGQRQDGRHNPERAELFYRLFERLVDPADPRDALQALALPVDSRIADKLERVAAQLSAERIQGWANPLVVDIMDAVRRLRNEAPEPDTGEAVLSATALPVDGWRPDPDKRYFVAAEDADGEYFWPMTYKQMKEAVDRTFKDAPHHGWPDGMDSFTAYELRPISKAVKTGEDEETHCEVCCGGEIDEWGPDGCPNCDGVGLVSTNDPTEPWHHDFEAITYYEMQPPLPPPPPAPDRGGE